VPEENDNAPTIGQGVSLSDVAMLDARRRSYLLAKPTAPFRIPTTLIGDEGHTSPPNPLLGTSQC